MNTMKGNTILIWQNASGEILNSHEQNLLVNYPINTDISYTPGNHSSIDFTMVKMY